jgi:hypothetical protein
VLKLPTPNGFIRIGLSENREDQLELWMSLDTSGGSTTQFTSNVIRLTDLDKGTEWTIEAKELWLDSRGGQIPYSRIVKFYNLPAAPKYILNDMEVWIPFSIDDFSPDAVRLYLPTIAVGSEEYKISPIFLAADKESEEFRKYGWWPYKWKNVKVEHFTVTGGATGGIHGSSKIDDRLKASELGGNIMIDFPADTKWKFATNEIRFEDVNTGEVRQMHFTRLQVHSRIRVAFTAPFCCSRKARMQELSIGIARAKKLRVEIPPLLINDKEFVIKPITFNLRKFDFGIYPFNC